MEPFIQQTYDRISGYKLNIYLEYKINNVKYKTI